MQISEWLVLAGGIAAIVLVNWYFFFATRASVIAGAAGGPVNVRVLVRGGYEPALIRVPANRPVRLVFDRQESSSCSEEVVFPAFSVRKFLPAWQQTAVDLPAAPAGTYEFTCGMNMLHGKVIAEERSEGK